MPTTYHAFFEDAGEVAGALIGLLFVAVSVGSERMRDGDSGFRVRAGIAFAALTNCLLVTLVALLPGGHLADAGIIFGLAGLTSGLWLAVIGARQPSRIARIRALIRVTALIAIFCVQIGVFLHFRAHPHDSGAITTIAFLTLAGFGIAIERSWELVGAPGISLLAHLERAGLARRTATDESSAPAEPTAED